MSVFLGIAIKSLGCEKEYTEKIASYLDIPDFVKNNLSDRFIPYLRAIQLDGYEKYKKRKLMIVGNTSKLKIISL